MRNIKTKRDKKCFLNWFKRLNCSVKSACQKSGWSMSTYYKMLNRDEEFRKEVDKVKSSFVETPELKVEGDELQKEVARIKNMFERQNRYDASLDWQIENVAMLHLKVMQEYNYMLQPEYESIKVETSREGNDREIINGHEALYQRYMELYQTALKNLCMTTESKPIKESSSGLDNFLNAIKTGK